MWMYTNVCKSADLFQSSSVLAYSCNPPTPSCTLQPYHPADCILLCCRLQDASYFVPSYRGSTNLPQAATGRHRRLDPEPPPPPPGLEIGAPACTGVPNSLLWLPC